MTFLELLTLLLAEYSVIATNVEPSGGSIHFHGKTADELMKHLIKNTCKDDDVDCSGRNCPKDCGDYNLKKGSGVYKIFPDRFSKGFDVYCNMEIDDGGWTVFQRRLNGETEFYRNWTLYEKGFGNLEKEFWLGNEKLHILTSQGKYEFRIDLEDFENNKRYAKYSTFSIGDASSKYKLTIGGYKDNAGDAMSHHNGAEFSTQDSDNDSWGSNCATAYKGAWWYVRCYYSNLNGGYLKGVHKSSGEESTIL